MDELRKIYVEPTNHCNLNCRTCIRKVWDETLGYMEWRTYKRLIDDLQDFSTAETIAFAGLGEPLLHSHLTDMVALAHENGLRTEITTNALLLTRELAKSLLEAGLDQIVVSIDGATADAFGDVRNGASLQTVIDNVRAFWYLAPPSPQPPLTIGIEFVAMKRNISELPQLARIAKQIGASFILVSNVIPYSADLVEETLYNLKATSFDGKGTHWTPTWILPRMDLNAATQEALLRLFRSQYNFNFLDINLNSRNNFCPFVEAGSLTIGWDGRVSSCPPLLHSYSVYVMGRHKQMRRYEIGRIGEQSLLDIWNNPAYVAFRRRVRDFDFSPCIDCGGCNLAETNEEDCFGNTFPVCGDCLWARGLIRCA